MTPTSSSRSPAASPVDPKSTAPQKIPALAQSSDPQTTTVDTTRVHPGSRLITLVHYQQILTSLQVIADAGTILLSFIAGYWAWSWVGPWLAIDLYEPESIYRYYSFLGVTLVTCLVGMEVHGLYQPQRSLMNVREFELILKNWGKSCMFTLGIMFMAHQLYFSRGIFALTWICLLAFMLMHIGFLLCLELGHFPYVSLASLTLFCGGWVWDALGKVHERRHPIAPRVYYDRDCGFCLKSCLLFRTFLAAHVEDPDGDRSRKTERVLELLAGK